MWFALSLFLMGARAAQPDAVVVSRAALESGLSSGVRALLHKSVTGEVDGIRISGLREDSILVTFGFKNGDIVHAVNGLPLTSMAEVYAAVGALREAPLLTIDITRRGVSMVRIIQFQA